MLRYWILTACLLLPALGGAVTVENLLEVRVPVENQTGQAREAAFGEALRQMVVRLTGRPELRQRESLLDTLGAPAQYVQQFQYADTDEGLVLQTRFYGQALRRALVQAGIPIWEAERPPVLAWIAVADAGGRILVGADQGTRLREEFDSAAAEFGIPVTFPDLGAGASSVTSSDVWGGFLGPIEAASEDYGTPLILAGRVERAGSGWRGRWTLLQDDRRSDWSATAPSRVKAFQAGAAGLAARLVESYAVLPDLQASERLRVHIRQVNDTADYARAETYLRGLGGVVAARLLSVDDGEATFELTIDVDPQRVLRDLRQDSVLVEEAGRRPRAGSADDTAAEAPESGSGARRVFGQDEYAFRLAPWN